MSETNKQADLLACAVALCEIVPPHAAVPTIDHDLERTVLKALERDPRDRFQTAEEFLDPLLALARRMPNFRDGAIVDVDAASAAFASLARDRENDRPTLRHEFVPEVPPAAPARKDRSGGVPAS